jgi:BirA family biotin operon repressor/biotin-[acetyl-CoA-carboxylase] ligase
VSLVTLVVGLAVRAAASRHVTHPLSVKWPNDVVFGRKKLAGILVESRLVGAAVDAVVVGVGLNVHMTELPPDIASIATSLALLSGGSPPCEDVLAEVLGELEERLVVFEARGLAPFVDELRKHDALLGERLTVGDVSGVGAGIDAAGALLVDTGGGDLVAVTSGTVQREAP